MRTTRATASGSPRPQQPFGGWMTSRSTSSSDARRSNSAATARASSPSSTGSERSCTAASRRLRSSSSPASADSRRSSRRALVTWSWASSMSTRPSCRSSASSSIVPWSIVSGVRSSCEAVETNERRAASWRRSSSCIRASARARSPTSSRPVSLGAGASGPSAEIRSATARSRPSRRSSVFDSVMPSRTATSSPMRGRGEQRVADLVDRRGHLRQAALGDEHPARRPRSRAGRRR